MMIESITKFFVVLILSLSITLLLGNQSSFFKKSDLESSSGAKKYLDLQVNPPKNLEKNTFLLKFNFSVHPPYHINSSQPLDDFLIPTKVEIISQDFKVVNIKYSPPLIRTLRGDQKIKISVYQGDGHTIEVKTTADLRNKQNDYRFKYKFKFQPCNEEICFPPIELSSNLSFSMTSVDRSEKFLFSRIDSLTNWLSYLINEIKQIKLSFIFLTLLGGFLLNFMPCVLPVISLKLFSLTQIKNDSQFKFRRNLFFYSLGVFSTFILLGLLTIILKLSGEQIGWGFQFQNPYYLILMIVILYFAVLILFDLLQIKLKIDLTPIIKAKKTNFLSSSLSLPLNKNFIHGFITVLLATPCIAPFLGISAGFALSKSFIIILLFYSLVAVGFLLPLSILFLKTDFNKWIPKGKGTLFFKQLTAFPLIAMVIWFLSILEKITSSQVVYQVLVGLFFLSLVIFLYKKIVSAFKTSQLIQVVLIFLLPIQIFSFIYWIDLSSQDSFDQLSTETVSFTDDFKWVDFDPSKIQSVLEQERPVLVHFTADWCLNCKVNEYFILNHEKTKELFLKYQVVKFKADWTKSDPIIYQAITNLNRAGIPLDVIYLPNKTSEKKYYLLNEILTYKELESVLSKI